MIVFKLERERPAFATHGNQLYYIKVGGAHGITPVAALAPRSPLCSLRSTDEASPAASADRHVPPLQERYIRCYDFATQRDNPLVAIRRNPSAAYNQGALKQTGSCLLFGPAGALG